MTGLQEFLLAISPLLVLVAFLLRGVFPGEETIERLARTDEGTTRRARPARQPRFRPGHLADRVSGGLLLAMHRANRPPPALLA